MKILVLVKPVPDPDRYGELKIDPVSKRLIREGVPAVLDPCSKNALEAALKCKTTPSASAAGADSVTVLAMAPEFSRDKITECLAMGADRAFMLSDKAFAGADTYATSRVLAEGIRAIEAADAQAGSDNQFGQGNFDLIIAGNESADGATAHVPVQVAEWLKLPHMAGVSSLEVITGESDDQTGTSGIRVSRKTEDEVLTFTGSLPAVIAVTRDINKPRLINAMGIIKARKKPLTIWSNDDLNMNGAHIGLEGSPTQPGELFTPDISRAGRPLTEDEATAEDAAAAILSIIKKAGV